MKLIVAFFLLGGIFCVSADYRDPHWQRGRSVIVHLFEWKWSDIAAECERFLAPNGYAGVQISPPNENFLESINNRPWSERYQPMSYKLITRSGNEASFADMTRRCNAVGIRIYPDIVVNHMSGMSGSGTAGSYGNSVTGDFPAVPYKEADFNPRCTMDWNNPPTIRNCEIYGLRDLNQTHESVRTAITDYMNHLIDLGVAGFRVDIMKVLFRICSY
jgi:alpha-amylase